ncbi:MAG: tRNA (adenosine(37)-N6)-threonylcarbamoyltransferase complex dimerization subunit type 1 TsaB [Pseudomonadota bacterium]
MSDPVPLILGFDTSGPFCAAALIRGDTTLITMAEGMKRGQAERLMPMLEECLAAGHVTWRDVTALGVSVGPGNFTGIRVAVAAARGLALGLGIPAVGVSGFDARQAIAGHRRVGVAAPQDQVYVPFPQPRLIPMSAEQDVVTDFAPGVLAKSIAQIALNRYARTSDAPAPFYLRPANAAPSRDLPPRMLD